jgi:hypothetical protein
MTTSMITAPGTMNPSMATFGTRVKWTPAGLLTAPATGIGSALGVGLGWTTRLGASPRITTAAGRISAADGAGALGRSTEHRSMALLSWASSVAGLVLASAGSR